MKRFIRPGTLAGTVAVFVSPTAAFAQKPLPEIRNVAAIAREQSNSSVVVDNKFVVKVLRRITPGIHQEDVTRQKLIHITLEPPKVHRGRERERCLGESARTEPVSKNRPGRESTSASC